MSKKNRIVVRELRPGRVQLDSAEAHYAIRVRRMRSGEQCIAFDPWAATQAEARLLIGGGSAAIDVGQVVPGRHLGWPGLVLCQALGKGDKAERVLRDAVALGASEIVFVDTARSVPRRSDKTERSEARWQSILLDAARQCERSDLPRVAGPIAFDVAVLGDPAGVDVVFEPSGQVPSFLTVLDGVLSSESRGVGADHPLRLWVGPEGGFSEDELAQLIARGAIGAALGPLVLRTELAATVVLACASARLQSSRA